MTITQRMSQDLADSGLVAADMNTRILCEKTMNACRLDSSAGYVIPYHNIEGEILDYYRVKVFDSKIKYRQVANSGNHVYFPLQLHEALEKTNYEYIIITEGEKKATAACKFGYPTICFGGVDSWRNKLIQLPESTELMNNGKGGMIAKLPTNASHLVNMTYGPIAAGFNDLVSLCHEHQLIVYIMYDRDTDSTETGLKFEVQRAATDLAFELASHRIPLDKIKQLKFPSIGYLHAKFGYEGDKCGIDDFLVQCGKAAFTKVINNGGEATFPYHFNAADRVKDILSLPKITRDLHSKLSMTMITYMDAFGQRMFCTDTGKIYYFNKRKSVLMHVPFGDSTDITIGKFGRYLYKEFGVSWAADSKMTGHFMSAYTGEDPYIGVKPKRVFGRKSATEDLVRLQISDSQYVQVDGSGTLNVFDNGHENVLFEEGFVEPLNTQKLLEYFEHYKKEPPKSMWKEVFEQVRLKEDSGMSVLLHVLLYYITPFLRGWRGIQLPVEIITGEAGSGKSTLCELRQMIIMGMPLLRAVPKDIKAWDTAATNSGGLHVLDNTAFADKVFKQQLSDELCRIVTDPDPHVEMRQLYTTNKIFKTSIQSTFAFTAITNPFTASDLLQRSTILELDKFSTLEQGSTRINYDGTWKERQLSRFGGREAWLAHHLHVLDKFFALAQEKWSHAYKSKCRLIHLEQTLKLIGEVLYIDTTGLSEYMTDMYAETVIKADWTLEGLVTFANEYTAVLQDVDAKRNAWLAQYGMHEDKRVVDGIFPLTLISNWATMHDSYNECVFLTNTRRLGRYISTHKTSVLAAAHMCEGPKINGNKRFKIVS